MSYIAIAEARQAPAQRLLRQTEYSVRCLARRLSDWPDDASASNPAELLQQSLREFVQFVPVVRLRVVDSRRRVTASSDAEEIGTTCEDPLATAQDDRGVRWTRIPVRRNNLSSSESPDGLFLEAQIDEHPLSELKPSEHTRTLLAVGIVFAALFVVYRFVRRQLRGVFRIVERIESRRDRIERDLAALRITDSVDTISTSWNQLIDSAQGWLEAVHRSAAQEEVTRGLLRVGATSLAEALHALPDGIVVILQEGKIDYLNAAARRWFGWNRDERPTVSLNDIPSALTGAPLLDVVRQALRPDGGFELRNELVDIRDETGACGSSLRVQVVPLDRSHREGACIVHIRDVSQQIRADKAREEFVTQVTHELRTPLTNIRAYAETLASGLFDDPKVITDCYNVITKETRRLSRLIEDMLSVSQLEVGAIEVRLDQVDLRSMLSEAVRDVRGLADEKNIDLQLLLPAKAEQIRADRDKLAVVINNLLGNAIKYTPKEGNVVVGCQFGGNSVVITVKDNGIGIAPADHVRIFEKFHRVNDPAVLAESGTGIGLYTAREIVRRHGGEIEIMSEKGLGSTFMVRLPHEPSRAGARTTAELPQESVHGHDSHR